MAGQQGESQTPDGGDLVVRSEALTKRYGNRLAVDGVTWSVRRGTVYGLVGPNGAGKTTLLRMVAGLVRGTSGQLEVGGAAVVSGVPPVGLGAMIESPGFIPHLSGRENLRHLARLSGLSDTAVEEVLARVCLRERAADKYRTYSLGMKQRLGVAAALLGSPALLVLDEPTNGLDPSGVADMHVLIRELSREGVTVVVSSHALADVEQLCRDVAVMIDGQLVADAAVMDLTGPCRTRFRTLGQQSAMRLLTGQVPALSVTPGLDDQGFFIEVEAESTLMPDRVAGLVSLLAAEGIGVYEVTPVRRTLLEAYDDLLGQQPVRAPTVDPTASVEANS